MIAYIVTGLVGACLGVVVAEATTPRWKPILTIASASLVITLALVGMNVFRDWKDFPPSVVGLFVYFAALVLHRAYIWSRLPLPITQSYWWWLTMSFFDERELRRVHEASTETTSTKHTL